MPATDIGIDLGTSNIVIWYKGKGIIVHEPTMVAYDKENDKIVAYGEEARQLVARAQGSIVAVRPFKAGMISDYSVTEKLMWHYIQVAMGRQMFRKRRMSRCIPPGTTSGRTRGPTGCCRT